MKINLLCIRMSHILFTALMLHGATADAALVDFTGRGVFHFVSGSGCPSGGRNPIRTECNRIAIDLPKTRVAVDTANHTIVFSSDATQKSEMLIGDVLLHGSGVSEQGQRVPLSLHLLLRRTGKEWDVDSYIHAPVGGNFSDVAIDPYQIAAHDGTKIRVLLTPDRARHMFADPSLRRRLARAFVSVRATNAGSPAKDDITIALGLGKFATSVLRAGFTSTEPALSSDVEQIFKSGNWTIDLAVLSDRIPLWVVQRELFLFGLDTHAALRTVREAGLKNHDTLTFGARGGKGFLRMNGQEAAFDGAAASGQAFMQESFIGLILAWQRGMASRIAAESVVTSTSPAK